ncbi:MAG: hypothetical protein JO340_10245 [Acidobacteriaceae bacterium]|nr:hypothetical protein [Acidobacteriaceae bacterium]
MHASRYHLGKATRAVFAEDGLKGFVLLPEGSVLSIESFDSPERLVRVRWNNLLLLMFWQDLLERAVPIPEPVPASAPLATQSL